MHHLDIIFQYSTIHLSIKQIIIFPYNTTIVMYTFKGKNESNHYHQWIVVISDLKANFYFTLITSNSASAVVFLFHFQS